MIGPRVATDIYGDRWAIERESATLHGWPVVYGRPMPARRGGMAVVLTPPLADYLEQHRRRPIMIALPIGHNTVKRLRAVLGHAWRDDNAAWWEARADDLAALTVEAFAARHGVSTGAAATWRLRLYGRTLGAAGWHLAAEARSLLASDAPAAALATQLGITASSVRRLRWMLAREG